MTKQDNKQSETPVTKVDPKRAVQTIEIAQLEDVIGGLEEGNYPLRMATEE